MQNPLQTAQAENPVSDVNIEISFQISDEIKEKMHGANVFIYAKQPQGMPMPIAAQRYKFEDLPDTVYLTKADELMPSRTLKQFKSLIIGVKITKSDAIGKDTLYKNEVSSNGYEKYNFTINNKYNQMMK